jgi:hypothetical protein
MNGCFRNLRNSRTSIWTMIEIRRGQTERRDMPDRYERTRCKSSDETELETGRA